MADMISSVVLVVRKRIEH